MSSPETSEDSFGFGSVNSLAKERIKQIKPAIPADVLLNLSEIDAIADHAGFISRESAFSAPSYQSARAPRAAEPRIAVNLRCPLSLATKFQKFCEENRYSYPEGLGEIMRRAGL